MSKKMGVFDKSLPDLDQIWFKFSTLLHFLPQISKFFGNNMSRIAKYIGN